MAITQVINLTIKIVNKIAITETSNCTADSIILFVKY